MTKLRKWSGLTLIGVMSLQLASCGLSANPQAVQSPPPGPVQTTDPEEESCIATSNPPTAVLVNGASGTQGQGAANTVLFTVLLGEAATDKICVHYETVDRTAVAGVNYLSTKGTLVFTPGQVAQEIKVNLIPNPSALNDLAFFLSLTNPINAKILTSKTAGIIINGALTPETISIADVEVHRGLSGSKSLSFTLKLAKPDVQARSVTLATSNLTAIAGVDYVAKAQTITFNPGETSKTFSVTIEGVSTPTPSKVFLVTLTNSNVPLSKSVAAGILDYGP